MICKWCGETLKTGAKTCKRCKREIPAKSDCGGFYDLVPLPGTQPPEVSAPVASTPVTPECAPYADAAPGGARGTLNPKIVFGGAIAVILILVVMVIALSGKLAEANNELDKPDRDCSDENDTVLTENTGNLNGSGDIKPTEKPTDPPPKEPENPSEDATTLSITLDKGRTSIVLLNEKHHEYLNNGKKVLLVVRDEDQRVVSEILLFVETEHDGGKTLRVEIEGDDILDLPSAVFKNMNKPYLGSTVPMLGYCYEYELEEGEKANITCILSYLGEDHNRFEIQIDRIVIN